MFLKMPFSSVSVQRDNNSRVLHIENKMISKTKWSEKQVKVVNGPYEK